MPFSQDILSKDTSLYPVVIIDKDGDPIHISTNSTTIEGNYYKPILLNVPSLKESIDLERRKYRISSVTLTISNFEQDGVRFSELVGNTSLANQRIDIYWVSPSVTTIDTGNTDTDALHIYHGYCRKYSHDDEKASLLLEDRSQLKLHKIIPDLLPIDDTVPDKYKNKPIPMVYGNVNNSPVVLQFSDEGFIKAMCDRDDSDIQVGTLGVNISGTVLKMPSTIADGVILENEDGDIYPTSNIPHVSGAITYFYLQYDADEEGGGLNPHNDGNIVAMQEIFLSNMLKLVPLRKKSEYWSDQPGTYHGWYTGNPKNVGGKYNIMGTLGWDAAGDGETADSSDWDGTSKVDAIEGDGFENMYDIHTSTTRHNMAMPCLYVRTGAVSGSFVDTYRKLFYDVKLYFGNWTYVQADEGQYYDNPGDSSIMLRIGSATTGDHAYNFDTVGIHLSATDANFWTTNAWHTQDGSEFNKSAWITDMEADDNLLIYLRLEHYYWLPFRGIGAARMEFNSLMFTKWVLIEGIFEQDYFSSVDGRLAISNSDPKMPDIITDIMSNELNVEVNSFNDIEYQDWGYAFSQHSKIDSKKLIESLASASPYIPRYNHLGEWVFNVIKKSYTEADILESTLIKKSECITYSYTRSKLEDIKTRCKLNYNWNYAIEEFVDYTDLLDIKDILTNPVYDNGYYGLIDDEDSTLIIDDDRGKYITTSGNTAEHFAKWTLLQYCNQHLIIKVKLPLAYLSVSVGSLIRFDEELGDALPYGINYAFGNGTTSDARFTITVGGDEFIGDVLNGQQIFPVFMVTETQKSLTDITLTCYQLHNLSDPQLHSGIGGCNDGMAWNYDPSADFDNGSCILPSSYIQNGCPLDVHPASDDIGDEVWSNNYIGDEVLDQEGVFVFESLNDPLLLEEGNAPYNYLLGGNDPLIFLKSNCTWQDIIPHELRYVYVYEASTDTYLGQVAVEDLETDRPDLEAPIEIPLDTALDDGQTIREIYEYTEGISLKFIFHFGFDPSANPTFMTDNIVDPFFFQPQTGQPNYYPITQSMDVSTNPYIVWELVTFNDFLNMDEWHDYQYSRDISFAIRVRVPAESDNSLAELDHSFKIILKNTEFLLGDINDDGVIDWEDVYDLWEYVLDSEAYPYNPAGDLNEDGAITVVDWLALIDLVTELLGESPPWDE